MALQCWHCGYHFMISFISEQEASILENTPIQCPECQSNNYIMGDRTFSYDDYYESMAESQEAQRTEEAAHGAPTWKITDDDYESEPDTHVLREDY